MPEVEQQSHNRHKGGTLGLVKVRISGKLSDVEAITQLLRSQCVLELVSADYENRDGSGVRRYVDLIVNSGTLTYVATLDNPKLPKAEE